jgi:hypothetical protein
VPSRLRSKALLAIADLTQVRTPCPRRIICQCFTLVNCDRIRSTGWIQAKSMPAKTSSKPRPPERDYSHRSLLDKLGVKTGQRILILGLDDGAFINDIQPFDPEFEERKPAADVDLIFFAAPQKKDLARLAQLRKSIAKNGAIWVVYPKGRQEIRELDVITAGKGAGLTDNKVCSFSATHTALRFVIPLANR